MLITFQINREVRLILTHQRLREKVIPDFDMGSAEEDSITLQLYKVLYDEVFARGMVDGFDDERFTIGTRESKLPNYNGSKPDLMPDLLVALKGRRDVSLRTQDWLFIECKPVDANHTVGVHYGAKGIARFIRGDYAWAMTSALMVGYAGPEYNIAPKLFETLTKRAKEFEVLQIPEPCNHSPATSFSPPTHSTIHKRSFQYLEVARVAPPITLRHLWLKRAWMDNLFK
jgi:hypothetical protein